jgi:hypothetical protein
MDVPSKTTLTNYITSKETPITMSERVFTANWETNTLTPTVQRREVKKQARETITYDTPNNHQKQTRTLSAHQVLHNSGPAATFAN